MAGGSDSRTLPSRVLGTMSRSGILVRRVTPSNWTLTVIMVSRPTEGVPEAMVAILTGIVRAKSDTHISIVKPQLHDGEDEGE